MREGIRAWIERTFSPRGFLVWGCVFLGLFVVCHLAGFREHTGILSGTLPEGGSTLPPEVVMALGGCYVLTYFGAVLLTPVLFLAAGVFGLLVRSFQGSPERPS